MWLFAHFTWFRLIVSSGKTVEESLKSPSGLLLDIADCRDLAHGRQIVHFLAAPSTSRVEFAGKSWSDNTIVGTETSMEFHWNLQINNVDFVSFEISSGSFQFTELFSAMFASYGCQIYAEGETCAMQIEAGHASSERLSSHLRSCTFTLFFHDALASPPRSTCASKTMRLSEMGKDIPGSIVQEALIVFSPIFWQSPTTSVPTCFGRCHFVACEAELSLNEHPYVTKDCRPDFLSVNLPSVLWFALATLRRDLLRRTLQLERLGSQAHVFRRASFFALLVNFPLSLHHVSKSSSESVQIEKGSSLLAPAWYVNHPLIQCLDFDMRAQKGNESGSKRQ